MNKPMTIQEFARMGGNATLNKHGKDYFKELSKKGVEARKKKKEPQKEE